MIIWPRILPGKGGEVVAIADHHCDAQLYWHSPWGLRDRVGCIVSNAGDSLVAWVDQYEGGGQSRSPDPRRLQGRADRLPWQSLDATVVGGGC